MKEGGVLGFFRYLLLNHHVVKFVTLLLIPLDLRF